jgi:hypothetical protein
MISRKVVACMFSFIFATCLAGAATAADFRAGFQIGYTGGVGAEVNAAVSDFAEGFPMALRFAIGYTSREPGKAADARRIFINDATNGTPEENGWFWDYRFDLMYRFALRSVDKLFVVGGVRYAQFTSNFKFIGGNEDFDVTSNQWGIGLGLEGYFDISSRLEFMVGGGFDYFFDSTLKGHDTEYNPDGDHVNPRNDYTYDDANDAINQPTFIGRALIGLSYRFGG